MSHLNKILNSLAAIGATLVATGLFRMGKRAPAAVVKPLRSEDLLPTSVTALTDLAQHLAAQTDLDGLFRAAGEWLHREYGIQAIVTYRYQPATNDLGHPITTGPSIGGLPLRLRLGSSIYGQVATTGTPYLVESIEREPRLQGIALGMQSAYLLPLGPTDKLVGVMCLQSVRSSAFSQPSQAMLRRIATLIGTLGQTTVRYLNGQETIRRFARFQQAALNLSTRLDSNLLLREIAEAARDMLGTNTSILLDYPQEEGDLFALAWSGISDQTARGIRARYREDLEGLVAWAKRPARSSDLRTDQRTGLGTQVLAAAGMISELAVPVLFADRLFGVLAVQTDVPRDFTDEDMSLLMALASHASLALRNAQLFERLDQANQQLERTVSDLVIANQQADIARLSAVESSQLKTEFVNNMSHELRTPLNAVINFTRIVMDGHAGAVSTEQVGFLTHVHDSGQHLLGLINDILDLAKIEAGKMELRPEPTDLMPILKGVLATAIGLTRHKQLSLTEQLDEQLPTLVIDPMRVRQVLLNLLSNAAKFTDQGGITLKAYCRENTVVVAVSDTGIGIAPEDMTKVFEEFRQLDGSLARSEGGTGLGMSISRRFVQLHGGDMWIESEIGKGTTVSFSLPIRDMLQ